MVGSKVLDRDDDNDDADVSKQQQLSSSSSDVSCSICLDVVSDNGVRSRAKLHCGHEFHLDCIGSAFNMKGAMQCPNCRKVEKGRWLYANGSTRSVPDFTVDEWIPDEEPYDIAFPELPVRVHWCPFSGLTRVRSSFEEVESPSTTWHADHDLQGHHAIFAEHTAASSISHSYVAYVGHVPPPPSDTTDIVDDPSFNTPWNGVSAQSDIFGPHAFPPLDNQYQRWSHRSAHIGGHVTGVDPASNPPATLRSSRGESNAMPRSGLSAHPFLLSQGRSGPRAGTGFAPHLSGGNVRSYERFQVPPVFQHPQQSSTSVGMRPPVVGIRRYSGTRGAPTASHSDNNGGFYALPPSSSSGPNVHEAGNPLPSRAHAWSRFPGITVSRDSSWGSFQLPSSGSESGSHRSNQGNWS